MTAALFVAATAVLLLPGPGPGPRLARLRRSNPARLGSHGLVGASSQRLRALARVSPRRWGAATGVAALVVLSGVVPVLPALCGAVVCGLAVQAGWTALERRAATRGGDDAVAVVAALADELRAGRSPPEALAAVAGHATGEVGLVLADAARAELLGGDTAAVLAGLARLPGGEELVRVAGAWRLSRASGCSLAEVLDTVAVDLRARLRHRRLLAGLLAGPRASALLLAALPVVGLAMGAALGADPLYVLTATGPGQVALVVGVALDLLGLAWTSRLVRGVTIR